MKERLRRLRWRLDCYQQEHTWLGFPVAVVKKFGEDQAGGLAALIAYYAFLSIFPLMLVFLTVMGYVVGGNEALRDRLRDSALAQFPVIGKDLSDAVHGLHGSGLALVVGILGALWGGLAFAKAAQSAFNAVWDVPMLARPHLLAKVLRSLLLLAVLGVGVILSTVVSGLSAGAASSGLALGVGLRVLAGLASLGVNTLLFAVAFRVLTVRDVSTREVLPGAVVAGVCWQALQWVGGFYVSHRLAGASQTYGTFGFVIGMLSLFYLQAQLTLFAAEINVVLSGRLWPRGLVDPPETDADRRAYATYARVEQYRPGESIETRFGGNPTGATASPP